MGVDIHGGTDVGMSQQFLNGLRGRPIGEQITRERVPLRYNNDKPEESRIFKGFSLIFDPFPTQKSSRENRRTVGGVSLTTNNFIAAGSFVPATCGRFNLLTSCFETPFFHAQI